jgi:hypothetical protein
MTRYVFLSLFAVWATTYAMMYEPETQGYTPAERTSMDRLVARSVTPHATLAAVQRIKLDLPFACGDLDKACLTLWSKRPSRAPKYTEPSEFD